MSLLVPNKEDFIMMITKETFVSMITTICTAID